MKSGCKPFLKWPGGKRWLCPTLVKIISELKIERYFEPFLGGGALFFALNPIRAVLSDVNPDLINVYRQVRYAPHKLIAELQDIPVTKETYDSLRADRPSDNRRRAARFLFLNRTAFAGMYRVNRKGEFNVPYGGGKRRPDTLWRADLIVNAAQALRSAELRCEDFEAALSRTVAGDLVFCDPTYTVAHNHNGFVRYNESNFQWADQQRLAIQCRLMRSRGVTVMVSNAFHCEIRSLYRDAVVYEVDRYSTLCPSPDKRRQTKELLFCFHP